MQFNLAEKPIYLIRIMCLMILQGRLLILNANSGISLRGRTSQNNTILDIEFDAYEGRAANEDDENGDRGGNGGLNAGHSGILVKDAEYNLIHNVQFNGGPYVHSLNADGAKNNVFSRFKGSNMQMDWHGGTIRNNLWTEWDLGEGRPGTTNRPTYRGGGQNEVLWNIKADLDQYYYDVWRVSANSGPKYQGADVHSNNIVVGLSTTLPTEITANYHHEKINPTQLEPKNLYLAQLQHLNKPIPQSMPDLAEDGICVPIVNQLNTVSVVCL